MCTVLVVVLIVLVLGLAILTAIVEWWRGDDWMEDHDAHRDG